MWPLFVVFTDPFSNIFLELFNRIIDLSPERDLVELIQYGFLKAFDSVLLRRSHFDFGVIVIFDSQVQLVLMVLEIATVFGTTVGKRSQQCDFVLHKEMKVCW